MNIPKISVIVPVYNVEKYLPRCIDSILAQTFTDFELLLIDDGSKDRSGEICDEYAKKDGRIRVFHKENGGVSSARNLGLDNAKGDWICFCDSDDWLHTSNTFSLPFHELKENIDIIEIPYSRDGNFKKIKERVIIGKNDICRYYANNFHNELWGRIFSRRLLRGKRFVETLKIGEDVTFLMSFFSDIHSVYISSKGGYWYFRNSSSVMAKTSFEEEKKQTESYLKIIYQMHVPHEDIIGFYYTVASCIWSVRNKFKISNIDIIKSFGILKILSSKLTLSRKFKLIVLYLLISFFY